MTQAQEEERFEKEVEKRRMRIGAAGPEAVRREVGLEMFSSSEVGVFIFSASRTGPDGGSSFLPCMTLS